MTALGSFAQQGGLSNPLLLKAIHAVMMGAVMVFLYAALDTGLTHRLY